MNADKLKIIRAVLDVLEETDIQFTEPLLHAEVNLRLPKTVPLAEFTSALAAADQNGWLIGVNSTFHGRKWSISDAGRAARLEMR